ncbi:hypothetical protein LTR95_014507 [Oleoguttula sp. CCFEE 5521]
MYMDALLDSDLSVLKEAQADLILNDLPSNLFTYYDRILAHIQRQEVREDVLSALRLLLFAAVPLTVEQIIDACATMRLPGRDRALFSPGLRLEAIDLMRLLNGIVLPVYSEDMKLKLGTQNNVIMRMRHFSVAGWLRRASTCSTYFLPTYFRGPDAQRHITLQCFAYLIHCHEDMGARTDQNPLGKYTSKRFPFARYAAANWFLHAAAHFQTEGTSTSLSEIAQPGDHSEDNAVADRGLTRPTSFALLINNAILAPTLCGIGESSRMKARLEELVESLLDARRKEALFEHILKGDFRPHFFTTLKIDTHQGPDDERPATKAASLLSADASPHTPLYTPINLYPNAAHFLVSDAVAQAVESDSVFSGLLVAESLDNNPQYVALTHSWGPQPGQRSWLRVKGQSTSIPHHIFRWLKYWQQDQTSHLPVWIDAIAINVPDIGERSQQFSLMGAVYRQASYVVMWIGEGLEADLMKVKSTSQRAYSLQGDAAATTSEAASVSKDADADDLSSCLQATENMVRSRAFLITWICREVALAKEVLVQSGPTRIALDDLLHVAAILRSWFVLRNRPHVRLWTVDVPEGLHEVLRAVNSVQQLRHLSKRPANLSELMFLLRRKCCTYSQDRLFSLLDLLEGAGRLACSRMVGSTPAQTWAQLNVYFAQEYNPLHLLSINESIVGPSGTTAWPPSWNQEMYDYPLAPGAFLPTQPSIYGASRRPGTQLTGVDIALEMRGLCLDTRAVFVDTIRQSVLLHDFLAPEGPAKESFIRTALEDRMSVDGPLGLSGDSSTYMRLTNDFFEDLKQRNPTRDHCLDILRLRGNRY